MNSPRNLEIGGTFIQGVTFLTLDENGDFVWAEPAGGGSLEYIETLSGTVGAPGLQTVGTSGALDAGEYLLRFGGGLVHPSYTNLYWDVGYRLDSGTDVMANSGKMPNYSRQVTVTQGQTLDLRVNMNSTYYYSLNFFSVEIWKVSS